MEGEDDGWGGQSEGAGPGEGDVSGVVDRSPPRDDSPLETAASNGDADPAVPSGLTSVAMDGDARGATGGGTSSFFLGRKAALMSPIPTKNSSAKCSTWSVRDTFSERIKGRLDSTHTG